MENRSGGLSPSPPQPGNGVPTPRGRKSRGISRLLQPLERWLSAPAPDPLYLSNRTTWQKARLWLVVAFAAVVVLGLIVGGTRYTSTPLPAPTPAVLSPAEEAQKMLPDFSKVRMDTDHEIELVEAHIAHGQRAELEGTVRNRSPRRLNGAELLFDVTDELGSHLGAVKVPVAALQPGAVARFRVPVPQAGAAYAVVHEVHIL